MLAKEYLKLILSDSSSATFRQILAITFTNKAVGEMKNRILENLYAFGTKTDAKEQSSLFHDICEELSLKPEQLQRRSQIVLKRILHNYSFFEISTIDKFNHKIIKTFARDLQLAQNFEVELDVELLLEEAVGNLLERTGTDKELTDVLLSFSLEKIDDDKSWNIAYDLVEIGKLLFQENHSTHLEKLSSKTIHDFQEIQKNILSQIASIEGKAILEAQKILTEIDNMGFVESDFPRKTLPNHFKKISSKEFNPKALYNNKLEQNLLDNTILKSGDKRDSIHLSSCILESYLSIKKKIYQRAYLKNIYGNIVPLTVLNEIAKEIKNIENEKDIIPISSLNSLLSKEIKNQPVPFIYERMGEKYRHYFIDEFQDTSQMQWDNLIPLIGNALESENEKKERGSLFLVGDVKQAIYRWRGGRAEQFLNLINKKAHPFVVAPDINILDTNWRSHKEIVQFNNSFFKLIAPFLKDEDHKNLFLEGCEQKPNTVNGGFVQLSFLDKTVNNKEEVYCNEVLKAIDQAISKKHSYADICILVRDNNKGVILANFLSQNHIPIVSSDSLLLANNEKVVFLISLLKVIDNINDKEAAYQVLRYLASVESKTHDFTASYLDDLGALFSEIYGFHLQDVKGQPVLTILEQAIIKFDLVKDSEAYLTFLMDEVLLVEKRDGPGVYSFLNYWEQKKGSLSITAPDHVNAVKIMTVHKAKGLEFPVVIFPFANAIIDDKRKKKKSWTPALEAGEKFGLSEFLVNTTQDMLHYNELAAEVYTDESKKTALDAFNVLYVALTRAEKALYIISETGKNVNSLMEALSYADLFQYYLSEKGIPKNELDVYTFGDFSENKSTAEQHSKEPHYIPYMIRSKQEIGFTISTKSSQLWDEEKREAIEMGNLIHFALSQIKTLDDVPQVLEKLKLTGHAPKDSITYIEQKILAIIHHPKLKEFFTQQYQILNEQEILKANGESLRPDRIAIADNEATIIDYKTGKTSPSHKEQITEYADVLKEMNFKIKHLIIVYIDQEINPHFL